MSTNEKFNSINDCKYENKFKYINLKLTESQIKNIDHTLIALESIYNYYLKVYLKNYPNRPIPPYDFIKQYLYDNDSIEYSSKRNEYFNKRIPSSKGDMNRISINRLTCSIATIQYMLNKARQYCYELNKEYSKIEDIKLVIVFYNHDINSLSYIFFRQNSIRFVKKSHQLIKISGLQGNFQLDYEITDNSMITLHNFDNAISYILYITPGSYRHPKNVYRLGFKIPFCKNKEEIDKTAIKEIKRPDFILLFSIKDILISIYGPNNFKRYIFNPLIFNPENSKVWYINNKEEKEYAIKVHKSLNKIVEDLDKFKTEEKSICLKLHNDFLLTQGIGNHITWDNYIHSLNLIDRVKIVKFVEATDEILQIRESINNLKTDYSQIMHDWYQHQFISFGNLYDPFLIIMPSYNFNEIDPTPYIFNENLLSPKEYAYCVHIGAGISSILDNVNGHQTINYAQCKVPKYLINSIYNCNNTDELDAYAIKIKRAFNKIYDYS